MNLRQLIAPLTNTPLHPQWLILRERKSVGAYLRNEANGRVLDIGCGDRWASHYLAADCDYLGIDYPPTVALGYQGKPDLFGNALQLPLPDSSFDTVLLLDVLEHIAETEQVLLEINRVLKPGGVLLIKVPCLYPLHDEPYDYRRWTLHGLRNSLLTTGLQPEREEWHGQPLESSATLASIAMARVIIGVIKLRHPALLLTPLLLTLIPLVNIFGWLSTLILPRDGLMPLGYRVVARKLAAVGKPTLHSNADLTQSGDEK